MCIDMVKVGCEELYNDDAYQAMEDARRIDNIFNCYHGMDVDMAELSDILSDELVEAHEIISDKVIIYFVNGESMEVFVKPSDVEILMAAGSTRREAEKHLKRGAIIYDNYKEVVSDGFDFNTKDDCFGIASLYGRTYYIVYCL